MIGTMDRARTNSFRIDYAVAGWLGMRPILRSIGRFWRNHSGDQSAACLRAARGTPGKDDSLNLIVDFYGGFWNAVGTVSFVLFVAVGLLAKAFDLGQGHRWVLVVTMVPWVFFLLGSMTLVGSCIIRRPQGFRSTKDRNDGIPEFLHASRMDFWIAVLIALLVSIAFAVGVLAA